MSRLLKRLKRLKYNCKDQSVIGFGHSEFDDIIQHIEKLESLAHTVTNDKYAIKAKEGEPVFILLGHDPLAPGIVRLWASHKAITDGPNEQTDNANKVADEMEKYHG